MLKLLSIFGSATFFLLEFGHPEYLLDTLFFLFLLWTPRISFGNAIFTYCLIRGPGNIFAHATILIATYACQHGAHFTMLVNRTLPCSLDQFSTWSPHSATDYRILRLSSSLGCRAMFWVGEGGVPTAVRFTNKDL